MINAIYKVGLTCALTTTLVVATYGCQQPAAKCAAARGGFMALYKPVSGPPDCAKLKGEHLGINTYQAEGKDQKPDLDKSSIAIQSESLGTAGDDAEKAGLPDPDPSHKPYGFGAFDSAEPKSEFCRVPTLTPALQEFPAVPANAEKKTEAVPATSIKYEWSGMTFFVTATKLGTQFTGKLVRTVDGEACSYDVIGLSPYVPCEEDEPADKDNPKPDPTKCAPEADLSKNRATGSGIDPEFPTTCDPDLLVCVLTKETIPALK